MKSIDFTKPGGIPLTQDLLDYLQTANKEALLALLPPLNSTAGNSNRGLIVSQMPMTKTLISGTVYDYSCGSGWFFLNGELIRMTSSAVAGLDESTADAYVAITRTSSPLTYNDGSTPNVINDVYGILVARPIGTANSATLFLLKTAEKYGREDTFTTINVNTAAADGGVSGTISFKKNFLNNTLQINGFLGCANAQNFVASPASISYLLTIVPTIYRSTYASFFIGHVQGFGGNRIKDDLGLSWISQVECSLNPNGGIYANFIKPDGAVAGYNLHFNCIVPLD